MSTTDIDTEIDFTKPVQTVYGDPVTFYTHEHPGRFRHVGRVANRAKVLAWDDHGVPQSSPDFEILYLEQARETPDSTQN